MENNTEKTQKISDTDLQRYEMFAGNDGTTYEEKSEKGEWVKFDDVKALITSDAQIDVLPTDQEIFSKAIDECREIAGSVNGFRHGAMWIRDNYKVMPLNKEERNHIIIEATISESGTIKHGMKTDFDALQTIGLMHISMLRLTESMCKGVNE